MSIRNWVLRQLQETGYAAESVGTHGVRVLRQVAGSITKHGILEIPRPSRPDAVAYCADPDEFSPVTVTTVQEAISELPQVRMIIVTRRLVDPEVFEYAMTLGVRVDTFGGFMGALEKCDDISQYVHREESYFRKRVLMTNVISSIARQGHAAWRLERVGDLSTLTVATHDRYELTDDGFAGVLERYPSLKLNALVITNPAARGFGNRVVKTAQLADVRIYTINDFVEVLRYP